MSIYGNLMKTARTVKHKISAATAKPVYLSPVRRIGSVATKQRVCAMTFDDGPCLLPPSENPDGEPLTLELIRILEEFGAFGTFDVVGDTSGNYPDKPGRDGKASWGGVRYDHYPDIERDELGGAAHTGDIISRVIEGGHAVTNHGFAHILFGRKSLIYGKRTYFQSIDEVLNDLKRLHDLLKDRHGYEMTLARPAHYVDAIPDGFTAYDAYAMMNYTYMAADFDGAGWLPLSSYKDEVTAMTQPIERLLAENPDALCGQIIFQKDGFNMARRTPVADGLPLQLGLLARCGYKVLTVPELLSLSPFSDVGEDDPGSVSAAALIDRGMCAAFRDNTIRPDDIFTRGELYMTLFGREAALDRIKSKKPLSRREHPYLHAARIGNAESVFAAGPDLPLDADTLDVCCNELYGRSSGLSGSAFPRREVLAALAALSAIS